MNKSDLKTRMRVILRDGSVGLVMLDTEMGLEDGDKIVVDENLSGIFRSFCDDLKHKYYNEFDIMCVEKICCHHDFKKATVLEILFDRDKEESIQYFKKGCHELEHYLFQKWKNDSNFLNIAQKNKIVFQHTDYYGLYKSRIYEFLITYKKENFYIVVEYTISNPDGIQLQNVVCSKKIIGIAEYKSRTLDEKNRQEDFEPIRIPTGLMKKLEGK